MGGFLCRKQPISYKTSQYQAGKQSRPLKKLRLFSYFIPRRCLVGDWGVLKSFTGQHHFLSTPHSNIWDHHRRPTDQAPNYKAQVHITFKKDCLHNPSCLPKTYPHKTDMKDKKENCRAVHLPLHRMMSRAWTPKDMAFTASITEQQQCASLQDGLWEQSEAVTASRVIFLKADWGIPQTFLEVFLIGKIPTRMNQGSSPLNLWGHSHFCKHLQW